MKQTARQNTRPEPAPGPWAQGIFFDSWHPCAWIALACLIFLPTLFFGLTLLDDNVILGDMFGFYRDFSHFPEIWRRESFLSGSGSAGVYYRPLGALSLMLDAHYAGARFFSFRITNILLHLACACLVRVFLLKAGYSKGRAGILSLIFTVHPLPAQAIAWIPGRTDTLPAVFLLSSFILFMDFLAARKWRHLFWHLMFFAAALLTKELAVVLPAACVLYARLAAKEPLPRRFAIALLGGWLGLLAAWRVLRSLVLQSSGVSYSLHGMIKSVWRNGPAFFIYAGKMLFPINLSTYPILQDSPIFYGVLSCVLVAAALILSKNKNWPRVFWGLSWLLMFLLPSFVYPDAGILPVFFEYRAYMSLIGFLIILAETDCLGAFDSAGPRTLFFGLGLVAALAVVTSANILNYRDAWAHWQSAVKNSPHSAFAHRQMGVVYYFQGKMDLAEKEYRKSLEINPREPMVHNNLGVIYMSAGRASDAKAEYSRELEVNPGYDLALDNLGVIAYNEKNYAQAEVLWTQALRSNLNNAGVYAHLAVLYYNAGQPGRAKELVRAMRQRGLAPPAALENLK